MSFKNTFSNLKSAAVSILGAFIFVTVAFVAVFLGTVEANPSVAELGFVEYSENSAVLGSVVPASCESNPVDWAAPGPCVCNISPTPTCGGLSCAKTVSFSTNYDYTNWGPWSVYRDGGYVTALNQPTWSYGIFVPPGGTTISVRRPDGITICSAFVPGPPAPIINTFAPTPATINPGSSATLSWNVSYASTCSATSGGWSGAKDPASGSETVAPAATSPYTITCSGPGGTTARTVNVVVNPPVVTLTASPLLIGPGNSSTLTWTAIGATSCTASGGWSGVKNNTGDTESVSPMVTTSYTLTCTGPSGTTAATAAVTLPSGYIGASPCQIIDEASTCNTTVVWGAYNFLSTPSVRQDGSQFSTAVSHPGTGLVRPVNPDTRLFELDDTGSNFITSFPTDVDCVSTSVWAGGRCITLPIISITADPEVIRSGSTAELAMEIDAYYELTCTLSDGGAPYVFTHPGALTPVPYTRTTRPLTSAQIVDITCVSPLYPVVNADSQERIDVVPTVQEI